MKSWPSPACELNIVGDSNIPWSDGWSRICPCAICFAVLGFKWKWLDGLRKKPTICDATTGLTRNDVWGTSAEIPYWWRVTRPKCGASDWSCCEGNLFQPIGHLATTISILQGFAFLCDLALLLFKPHGITKCKYEMKNEKDSGRSSKMTSLCKWPIRSTTQIWVACEQQTHFRSSLLSLRKIASANSSSQTISVT